MSDETKKTKLSSVKQMKAESANTQHGGARSGSGRPKGSGQFKEPTNPVRIPLSAIPAVKQWLQHFHTSSDNVIPLRSVPEIFQPCEDSESQYLPLFSNKVAAGFPSPADDHIDRTLDLNEHLVQHPAATFFVRVEGLSMIHAGINPDDILVVDRSLEPTHGKIIIAALNGELTVKRLHRKDGQLMLLPENPDFSPIPITADCEFTIWGVVTSVIHSV